jgi:RHS repeat-associated protein
MTGSYTGCSGEVLAGVTATAQNRISNGSTYYYDTAGNMTTNSGATYAYDAENHLTAAAGVTYTYDGDGKRVEKSNGKIYWYGMDGSVLDETDQTGSTTNSSFSEYVFFNGNRIARHDSSNNVYYYAADHLGTSRVMALVPSGQTTASLCYDADFYPFGGERAYTNTCSQNYKFTGKERDSESNLDNFGARYNSSSIGRFMSPDPIGIIRQKLRDPQQWSMYSYARNNPLKWLDPTGQYVCNGTKQECKAEQQLIKEDLKSKDPKVKAAAKVYGPLSKKAGDKGDNGVTVKFGEQGHGGETQFSHDKTGVVVTMNSDVVTKGASAAENSADNAQGHAAVAHEGGHVEDYKADIANHFDAPHDITMRQSEENGYALTNSVLNAAGFHAIDSEGNAIDLSTPAAIDQFLRNTEPDVNLDAPISTNTEQ